MIPTSEYQVLADHSVTRMLQPAHSHDLAIVTMAGYRICDPGLQWSVSYLQLEWAQRILDDKFWNVPP